MQRAFLTFSALLVVGASLAQRAPFSGSFSGSGELIREGGRNRLSSVDLTLNRSGEAFITLVGEKRWVFVGRWRSLVPDDYEVTLTRAYGQSGRDLGRLRVLMDRDRVVGLEWRGEADGRFSGAFRVDRYTQGQDTWGGLDLRTDDRGRGDFIRPGRTRELDRVRSRFSRNGDFTLTLTDGTEVRGTYRRDGTARARLEIESVRGLRSASGSGTARFERDRLAEFSFTGDSREGRFRASWRYDRDEDDRPNRPTPDQPMDFGVFRMNGKGSYALGGDSDEVTRTELDLRRDGRLTLTLTGPGFRAALEGTWVRRDFETIVVDINRAEGMPALGSGTILMRAGGPIGTISIDGRSTGSRLSVRFVRGRD